VTFRVLATHYMKNYASNGINVPTDTAGQNNGGTATQGAVPSWRFTGSVFYANDPLSIMLTARGLSSGTYLNSNIECTSGCPTSTATNRTVSSNHIAGAVYFDTSFTYKFMHKDTGGADMEAFFNVRNLFNKDPAIVAQGPGGFAYSLNSSNGTLYDVLGRVFRAGVRFKL